jgi:hypothetical protein
MSAVVERYLLAQRVVARVKQSDSVGDPTVLLSNYQKALHDFAKYEGEIRTRQQKLKVILELKNSAPADREDKAAWDEYVAKIEALRQDLSDLSDVSARASTVVRVYGFDHLKDPAYKFCYAVIQQLALPPKSRKVIEAASKFWSKSTRRVNTKSLRYTEEYEMEFMERYFEDLELYQKYDKLFKQVLSEGKAHTSEGEEATSLRAGPFLVVNTGGFDAESMAQKVKLVEECTDLLHKIGLSKVCYGNVLITNRLTSDAYTQAFYHIASDELFIRGDAKVMMSGVQAVCHELAHRYYYRFLAPARHRDVKAIYAKIKSQQEGMDLPTPSIGEVIKWKGEDLTVVAIDRQHGQIQMKIPTEPKYTFSLAISAYAHSKGFHASKFVTPYAERGGPGENFAEMVAFYAMGKLPPDQVELLKPLL